MAKASDDLPAMICCAVTGSADTPRKSPHVPVTPEQIAQSAVEAARAGAAVVHIHVRDPRTGAPSMDLDLYRRVVDLISASGTDVIVNLTTGAGARFVPGADTPGIGGKGTTLTTPETRVAHVVALRPEICSLDVGTMNMGEQAFVNTPGHLRAMAAAVSAAGVRPELEVFDAGHVMLAHAMLDRGELPQPALFQLCLGVTWGAPATPESMLHMRGLLPAGSTWFAFGVGRAQFPMVALATILGGNVRVGLEDNLYIERGQFAESNAVLVAKAAGIVRALGRDVATAAQAREILGLDKSKVG